MIYRNIAHGPNEILATLAIKINRPNTKPYEVYFNGFVETPRKVNAFFEKNMRTWIKDELKKFSNQREVALREVGMLSVVMLERIASLRRIATCGGGHAELCSAIIKNQESIRMLLPSPNSRHYSWAPIIEEIIHYAHQQNARALEIRHHYEKQTIHQ